MSSPRTEVTQSFVLSLPSDCDFREVSDRVCLTLAPGPQVQLSPPQLPSNEGTAIPRDVEGPRWGLAGRGVSGGAQGSPAATGSVLHALPLTPRVWARHFLFTGLTTPSSRPTCTPRCQDTAGHTRKPQTSRGSGAGAGMARRHPAPEAGEATPWNDWDSGCCRSDVVTLTPLAPGMSVHTSWGIRTWRVHPRGPSGEGAWLVVTGRKG